MRPGKLPDGTLFDGPAGLKQAAADQLPRRVSSAPFTEKLLTYALGRGLEYYDQPAVRADRARGRSGDNSSISALIDAIVKSRTFQMRRTPET